MKKLSSQLGCSLSSWSQPVPHSKQRSSRVKATHSILILTICKPESTILISLFDLLETMATNCLSFGRAIFSREDIRKDVFTCKK